jgi:hypothetical protein
VATADDFLRNHPDLEETDSDGNAGMDSAGTRLDVTILGISANSVRFGYLGTEYRVDREAVLRLDDRQDPAEPGRPATLVVKKDAPLTASYSVTGADLVSSLPFAMARPPITPRRRPGEVLFRSPAVSLLDPPGPGTGRYPSLEVYLTAVSTTTACESQSGGDLDDSIGDDQASDYY